MPQIMPLIMPFIMPLIMTLTKQSLLYIAKLGNFSFPMVITTIGTYSLEDVNLFPIGF